MPLSQELLIHIGRFAAAAAKSRQLCPTLCSPIDGSSPGSPIPGILQARILEWLAISFSSAWKWKGKGKSLSRVWLLATPWTVAHQAPPSMGFSRHEYWSGVPLPSLLYGLRRAKRQSFSFREHSFKKHQDAWGWEWWQQRTRAAGFPRTELWVRPPPLFCTQRPSFLLSLCCWGQGSASGKDPSCQGLVYAQMTFQTQLNGTEPHGRQQNLRVVRQLAWG